MGQLQFEVFQYRLENEYNAPIRMNPLDFSVARWLENPGDAEKVKAGLDSRSMLLYDRFERPLLIFANQFTLTYYQERHKGIGLIEAMDIPAMSD